MTGTEIRKMLPAAMPVMISLFVVGLLGGLLAAVPNVQAADMFVYPKEGQDKAQQDKDSYECHSWAVQQTGFDPTKPPSTSTQTSKNRQRPSKLLLVRMTPKAIVATSGGADASTTW